MRRLLYGIILVYLAACKGDYGTPEKPQLVVEGWIDHNNFPIVFLTRSIPISEEYQDISDLKQYVERWARVTISDGEREEVMTGRMDAHYIPPYYYTTTNMRGEAGKTYHLHAECVDGLTADAVTTIPNNAVAIESFWVTPVEGNDTLFQLNARLDSEVSTSDYYTVFSLPYQYRGLPSSLFGVFSRDMLENNTFVVNRGFSNFMTYQIYYSINETVHVKIAAIDEGQYKFWRTFQDMNSLSRNPLFPVMDNLPTNISDGLGYWFGYSSAHYIVPIRRLVEERFQSVTTH